MWSRAALKEAGKINFKRYYWTSVLICAFAYFIMGGLNGSNSGGNVYDELSYNGTLMQQSELSSSDIFYNSLGLPDVLSDNLPTLTPTAFITTGIGIFILSIGFELLLINPINIGMHYYFLGIRHAKRPFKDVFFIFTNKSYFKASLTLFFRSLFTLLWGLLFIIPGIIKMYEYFMIPYILAENPTMDRHRVFELSHDMMHGQKWDTFVLQLSFIGWELLSLLTMGLLSIFYVNPYREATQAELYATLRQHALDHHMATSEELPGIATQNQF